MKYNLAKHLSGSFDSMWEIGKSNLKLQNKLPEIQLKMRGSDCSLFRELIRHGGPHPKLKIKPQLISNSEVSQWLTVQCYNGADPTSHLLLKFLPVERQY